MSELLLELYSEEIPFYFVKNIENIIKNVFGKWFLSLHIMKDNDNIDNYLKVYITPCRIIVFSDKINSITKIEYEEIVGPKIDAENKKIDEFLNTFNVSKNDLKKGKDNFILIRKNIELNTKQLLEKQFSNILSNISSLFPENVRWIKDNKNIKWIAPLRNILCLFDNEVLNFNFCGLNADNSTYGHKIITGLDNKIKISNFEDYKNKMKENFVIFDQNERKNIIKNEIKKIEEQHNLLSPLNDKNNEFLDEIVYTNEYPLILCGEFKNDFIKLPKFILINEIKNRYGCLYLLNNSNNSISNKFIIFAGTKTDNNGEYIINCLSNTINNRFSYVNNELTKFISENLENKINKLKEISYYDSFGTIYDKVLRLTELAKFVCLWIPHTDLLAVEQASKLSKIDNIISFAKDNINLKGHLSAYYAKVNSYSDSVCDALKEYYKPRSLNDTLPSTSIGQVLSIADKIDNITSAFIINENISSSEDLYSVRKNISSIIRIIIEGKINIPLNVLVYKSISLFKTKIYKLNNNDNTKIKKKINLIANNIICLFKKRFINFIYKNNYDTDVALAVLNTNIAIKKQSINLMVMFDKILKVQDYIKENNSNFTIIKNTYKRLNNILKDFNNTNINILLKKIFNKKVIKNVQEKELNNAIKENKIKIKKAIKIKNYNECFNILLEMSNITNSYFDNNIIKTKNKKDTNRKLFLLYKIKIMFEMFLNFNELL